MALTYFKRFRMEISLADLPEEPPLPPDFRFQPWSGEILKRHAEVKYQSFRFEVDANVFPCLGDSEGCFRLMREITMRDGFLPAATWLIENHDPDSGHWRPIATVQGVRDREGKGSIQNLGVVPGYRGLGIGAILLIRALYGFREQELPQASLEVTSQNIGAIRLYERLGFRIASTVYKAVEMGAVQTSTHA
ncbi:GNAT family N-acetyltransferase [Bremerella alba]|uniref:Mycothiol acetyltransferase n=1 Tax=Bremerella alba TaxID=980252 RepID=A0A7V9A7H2_9BACT|nr:N-acetyltransferase [Bremerella alba]MBA2115357.1 Mycothiol acetyltransferase [Bremerella alba]